MSDPYFFGYGSLVNRATHAYAPALRASLTGWRRAWKHTTGRDVPFLTVVPDPATTLQGLVAPVPGGDWAALDRREHGYVRHALGAELVVEGGQPVAAQVYAVPPQTMVRPPAQGVILMSYLDVVVQGYLREYGADGAAGFFATTDGWDIPVLDDRAYPLYPRHQALSEQETAFVDAALARLGARVVED